MEFKPMPVVPAGSALKLKAKTEFTELVEGKQVIRHVGDEW